MFMSTYRSGLLSLDILTVQLSLKLLVSTLVTVRICVPLSHAGRGKMHFVLYCDYNYILMRCIGQGTASGCMDVWKKK